MVPPGSDDPYRTLGVTSDASDAELRVAYRRLVQLHHPDHNGGSAESARRFEDVQEAYAQIRTMRQGNGPAPQAGRRPASGPTRAGRGRPASGPTRPASAGAAADRKLESRLADLERELRAARESRDRAQRAAREAARAARAEAAQPRSDGTPSRPSDEELGYIETDDSFTKILADAAAQFSDRLAALPEHEVPKHVPKRVSDLIDELASKLTGEPPKR